MENLVAIAIGILFASGTYLLLRRSLLKVIFGLSLIGNAANLLIFTAAGLMRGGVPIVPWDQGVLAPGSPDPLPQALILTAIVITFGVQAFALVLVLRAYQEIGSDDSDEMMATDDPHHEVKA
jgi:multicomponent Na+:H+ antiporter subunit C